MPLHSRISVQRKRDSLGSADETKTRKPIEVSQLDSRLPHASEIEWSLTFRAAAALNIAKLTADGAVVSATGEWFTTTATVRLWIVAVHASAYATN